MTPSEVYSLIDKMFSESGFSVGSFNVRCGKEIKIEISKKSEGLEIRFLDVKPKVSFKKIVFLSVKMSAIHLSKMGGVLELDDFPDIPFDFEDIL